MTPAKASCSTAASPRIQAFDRHLGQRRSLARALHRSFRALRARRGVRRPDRDDIVALVFPDVEACRKLRRSRRRCDGRRRRRRRRRPAVKICRTARRLRRSEPRHFDTRRARHPDGGAAVHGQRRNDRQGFDQPARGVEKSRRAGGRTLCHATIVARDRRSERANSTMEIKGQPAIVTGGASGLGAAGARACRRRRQGGGFRRQRKGAAEVAADVKGIAVACDVSDGGERQGGNQTSRRRSRPGAHPGQLRRHRPGQAHRRPRRADAAGRFRARHPRST